LFGAVLLLTASASTGEIAHMHPSAVSARSALGLVYLILFGSVVAFSAYTWLLEFGYSPGEQAQAPGSGNRTGLVGVRTAPDPISRRPRHFSEKLSPFVHPPAE
jgi:hypothetical protein